MNSAPKLFSPHYRRLAIVLLALSAYAPTLKMGFLWDDHVMIEGNPRLQCWSVTNLKHDFATDVFDGHGDPYYRPAQTWDPLESTCRHASLSIL